MYASAWPALSPGLLAGVPRHQVPFPVGRPGTVGFHAARYAIYQLLRGLGFSSSDTVLAPSYHHGNEIRAIRAAGPSVEFYQVGLDLQPDLEDLHSRLRARPRALFVIHYLGFPQPILELSRLCRELGVLLIEDCALSFLSALGGRGLGTFGDYAIFCLYKTLPVPNGGVLAQNGEPLSALSSLRLRGCGGASLAGRSLELTTDWVRGRSEALGRTLSAAKRVGGRTLSALGLRRPPVGDSGFEARFADIGISGFTEWLLARFDYAAIQERRRSNYSLLLERFRGRAPLLLDQLDEGVCPLFFPLLVHDKAAAAAALLRRGIDTVRFWESGDSEANPSAAVSFLRSHVLELPIHQDLPAEAVHMIADTVLALPGIHLPCSGLSESTACSA